MRLPTAERALAPHWYKDAIIYELHVKAFSEGNGGGVGDFAGLVGKLDYLERLGVSCVWLLPFYESPLRDDGYDIAHYERVHEQYGRLVDFRQFLDQAHQRGIHVITELVINHTSDRHPWFQAARRAPAGSPKREFYVWSDTDRRYSDARVIFSDAERSNWTWDPVAGAYYWHRFFHHQPDLNFDNPRVRRAVMKVMRFWLDMGVDGLRLDAVAHLYEREGTTCDNLPETHAFLKEIRAEVDARYSNRVLIAEANQPPAVMREYFDGGSECHMAFHFPLMPRLFLALLDEKASSIREVVERTADVPDGCQWAVFLRNHDELTFSGLAHHDRERLLAAYAPDPAMRLHGDGVRRRLAPLLDHDRRRLELAHALLLSLPGSPVLYYGDEIGMGEDLSLADRHGLRTAMPWDEVARQERDDRSLLASVKQLIRTRRGHPAFGRGGVEFLDCGNPRVLVFVRRHEADVLLVVANLSRSRQTAAIRLPSSAAAMTPVDCLGDEALPAIGASPFVMSLPPHACRWLQLAFHRTPDCSTPV